jgi:hypothetical protein
LGILGGKNILINESNIQQISDTIYFLEFDSASVHEITKNLIFDDILNHISSLFSSPIDSIQTIISSPFIHFQN